MIFKIIDKITEGSYVILTDGHQAVWTRRRLRKDTTCAASGSLLKAGELHYGPIGNQMYRYQRVARLHVETPDGPPPVASETKSEDRQCTRYFERRSKGVRYVNARWRCPRPKLKGLPYCSRCEPLADKFERLRATGRPSKYDVLARVAKKTIERRPRLGRRSKHG